MSNANARYFHNRVPFWNELMAHGTYDAYWQARNLLPHLRDIRPAMLIVGGWFDAEDFYGPLHIFKTIERASPATQNFLVVGPWPHGGWARGDRSDFGDIPFRSATAATYRDEIEFPFFNHYLKDEGEWKEPKARVFATGSNQWLSFDCLAAARPPRPNRSIFRRRMPSRSSQPKAVPAAESADSYRQRSGPSRALYRDGFQKHPA